MNILIIQQRNWAIKFGTFLSDKLKDKGHNIGCISVKKSTHNYLLNVGYSKNIWSHDEVIDDPKKLSEAQNVANQAIKEGTDLTRILGTLLVAFLATSTFSGLGLPEGQTAMSQFVVQIKAVILTVIWTSICPAVFYLPSPWWRAALCEPTAERPFRGSS